MQYQVSIPTLMDFSVKGNTKVSQSWIFKRQRKLSAQLFQLFTETS